MNMQCGLSSIEATSESEQHREQESILGPLLLNISINDLDEGQSTISASFQVTQNWERVADSYFGKDNHCRS